MEQTAKLSPKAWALYNFLKDRTLGTSLTVTQREIYEYLVENRFQITWSEVQNQHHDHCRGLKDLVDEINFSKDLDKMVYQKDWKYCIANEEQAEEIRENYHVKAMLALERESIIAAKCKRDGQGKLVDNAGNPMKPGNNEFHEAYNRPAPPSSQVVFITYEERESDGRVYSYSGHAQVPYGLTDEEIEADLARQMQTRGNCELKHWRKL